MIKHVFAVAVACAALGSGVAAAEQGTVVWYDATCRYFVMQLPEGSEGFGLYEWKEGPEPKEGSVISGDILAGPELNVVDETSGQQMAVVHWGDAKKRDTLIRHSPEWCKSKRKHN